MSAVNNFRLYQGAGSPNDVKLRALTPDAAAALSIFLKTSPSPNDVRLGVFLAGKTATETGFAQASALGTPVGGVGPVAAVGVGVAQAVALGTPAATENMPAVGVGVAQAVTLGTPAATENMPAVGVGVAQAVALGTPVTTQTSVGSQAAHGVGIFLNGDATNVENRVSVDFQGALDDRIRRRARGEPV